MPIKKTTKPIQAVETTRIDDQRSDKTSENFKMIETEFVENGKRVKVQMKQDLTDQDIINSKIGELKLKVAKGTATDQEKSDLTLLTQ